MSVKISRQEKRIAAAEEGEKVWKERSREFRGISDQMRTELFDSETGAYRGTQPLKVKDLVDVEGLAYRLDGQEGSRATVNVGVMTEIDLQKVLETIIPKLLGVDLGTLLGALAILRTVNPVEGEVVKVKELPEAGQEVEGGK